MLSRYISVHCIWALSLTVLPLSAQQDAKTRPVAPTPPPAAQFMLPAAPQRVISSRIADAPRQLHLKEVDDKTVSLTWTTPEEVDGCFEDFEGHEDFVINSPGELGWSYIDGDNEDTYTWTAASFPNQGQRMAYIVMNPSQTIPSTADWPNIQPYSGNKFLAAFTVDGGNNDFLISPELNFADDFQLSFRAKSYTDSYGLERIRVGYSTTGKRAADFIFIQEGDYEEVGTSWELKTYRIPKEAKYVTINCVSQEAFILMLDDIFIGTNLVRPRASATNRLKGFRLYRDGVAVSGLIQEVSAVDEVPDYATYTYTVQGEYEDGTFTDFSEPLVVEVTDIRLLPFFDSFDSNVLDAEVWNTEADSQGNKNYWKADYYPYGLVDPALTYCYSSLTNYSQSAVLRELHTLDRDNTYLRFNLRLDNGTKATGDTLSVEVCCDGNTWQRVDCMVNDEGSFNWRPQVYCLGDHLTGDLFRLRFRASGANASYVDYWYVDDVKVWNPAWSGTVTLHLTTGESPFAGCRVHLTADHGAEADVTTDSQGNIVIGRLEAGTWTAIVDSVGFNRMEKVWEVAEGQPSRLELDVLQPRITFSTTSPEASLSAESTASVPLVVRNEGNGPVDWYLDLRHETGSGDTGHAWNVERSFDASGDLQTCVAFDGENYYTSSWYYLGKFFKYDAEGNFLEEFDVPGMYYKLYDLAFDGTCFYGSDYSNRLFRLDLRNKRLLGEITVESEPSLKITHVSYDPRYDQFWVGSFTSIGRIDRKGNVVVSFRSIDSSQDLGIYGSAFDNVTPGGPYLWLANEMIDGLNEIDKVQIAQFNVNTLKMTGVTHSLIDLPGYKVGSLSTGENNICGIESTTSLVDGQLTLLGTLQQSPSRIFAYRLADATSWLAFSPKNGTLQPGEQQEVTLHMDSRNAASGEEHTATLVLHTQPELAQDNIMPRMLVNAPAAAPCPRNVTAKVMGQDSVEVSWTGSETATSYAVYRNGTEIARLQQTAFIDAPLVRGTYIYNVRAFHPEGESILSDTAMAQVNIGAPYFPPVDLEATLVNNREVQLEWQLPAARGLHPAELTWSTEANTDGIGLTEGGYFWVASAWDAEDLEAYRDMQVDSVRIFLTELCQSVSLNIYKDNQRITNQRVKQTLVYGTWNTIALEEPIVIQRGCEYKFGFLVAHSSGRHPIGVDGHRVTDGRTDVVSCDGKTWVPASYIGFDNGHFNIVACLSPAKQPETAPEGYHVWRDGERITEQPVTRFSATDILETSGVHAYQVSSVYGTHESRLSNPVTVERMEIGDRLAPSLLRAEVEHNRTVSLRWDIPLVSASSFPVDIATTHPTCQEGCPELVSSFRGAVSSEYGIASDGKNIYTTVFSSGGVVNRYALDGTFQESLCVDSYLDGIRNLAYDGQDFYAATTGSVIYRLDLEEPSVTDTIMISEIARHLAYVPDLDNGKGGFETGDWTTSIYMTRMGAKLGDGPTYQGAAGTAYHNGILYAFEQGYENPYVICLYDFATGKLLRTIDLKDYAEIAPASGAMAGGLNVVHTAEGLHLLAATLQEPAGARFFFFDLGSVKGLRGYNVYRNGRKLNDLPTPFRSFSEEVSLPGIYTYEVETEYVDGTTSARSPQAVIEIVEAGDCDAPADVKARSQHNGYDVTLSFVDPTSLGAEVFESVEEQTAGETFVPAAEAWSSTGWLVTEQDAWQGKHALTCGTYDNACLTLSFAAAHAEPYRFSFAARGLDDSRTPGTLRIYTRRGGDIGDFLPYATVTANEAWQEFAYLLPADVTDVQLKHESGQQPLLIDALRVGEEGSAYAYDIFRDGVQLNHEPVEGISYVDHNLPCGTYSYTVRAYYQSSCVSEQSLPATVTVSYNQGGQAPGPLSVSVTDEGNHLQWSAPALGEGITLKWHSGVPHAAAGMPSGGSYWAGVVWTAEQLQPYAALSLSEVEVYIHQIPDALFLLVYQGNDLVRSQYVPSLKQYSYNAIPLSTPLPIDPTRNLRVALYVEHNEISVPIGYDEGPARTGLGDLYSSDGVTWSTLTDNDIDGNWNVTLRLKAYAAQTAAPAQMRADAYLPVSTSEDAILPAQESAVAVPLRTTALGDTAPVTFTGYNVYCNSELLNPALLTETEYWDCEEHSGRYYEYCVKALYSDGSEVASNVVRCLASGVESVSADTPVRVRHEGECLWVEGAPVGTPLVLFDLSGREVARATAALQSPVCLSLRHLPQGTYLLALPQGCCKVVHTQTR